MQVMCVCVLKGNGSCKISSAAPVVCFVAAADKTYQPQLSECDCVCVCVIIFSHKPSSVTHL